MKEPLLELDDQAPWQIWPDHPLIPRLKSAWASMTPDEKLRVSNLQEAGVNWLIAIARVCGAFPVPPENLATQPQFTLLMPKKGS